MKQIETDLKNIYYIMLNATQMRYYIIFSLLVLSLQGFSKTHPPKIDLKEVIFKLKEFNDPTWVVDGFMENHVVIFIWLGRK